MQVLHTVPQCLAQARPQQEAEASYAAKIHKHEAEVDWSRPAADIDRQVRALFPRSPAFTWHEAGRLRLLATEVLPPANNAAPGTILACTSAGIDVACGTGVLRLLEVQAEGRKAMSVASLLNGHPDFLQPGQQLGGQGR